MEDTDMNYTEFKQTIRKNALANPSLYGGRYTCKSCRKAYEEYKQDITRNYVFKSKTNKTTFVSQRYNGTWGWSIELT